MFNKAFLAVGMVLLTCLALAMHSGVTFAAPPVPRLTQTTSVFTDALHWTASGGASSIVTAECPHPAWSATVPDSSAKWIWVADQGGACAGGFAPGSAPPEIVTFSTTFTVIGFPLAAELSIAVDDSATVFVNGHQVGTASNSGIATRFDIASYLGTGQNTMSIVATNNDNGCTPVTTICNPAGVLASVDVVSSFLSVQECNSSSTPWLTTSARSARSARCDGSFHFVGP